MRKLKNNQKGSILITFAIVLSVLVLVATASIDISKVVGAQSKLEHTLDSALLSAVATSVAANPQKAAEEFFDANYPNENGFTLTDLQVTHNAAALQWTAEASGTVETFYGNLGVDGLTRVSHSVTVEWDTGTRVEAVFAVDTSASMCTRTVRSQKEDGSYKMEFVPDNGCEKLNAMKESLIYILDNGIVPLQGVGGPTYNVGLVPFNHKIKLPILSKIPSPLSYEEATNAKGDANYFTNFEDAEPLSRSFPLVAIQNQADVTMLKNHINAITQQPEGRGWTRSNIAALTSALMLDPEFHNSFGGVKPAAFGSNTDKIVVLMSDGANIGCCYAAHPEGNYDNQYLYLYSVDNAHLMGLAKSEPEMQKWKNQYGIPQKGVCDAMKERGITIYTILFDVDDRDVGGKEIKDVFKSCASNEQFFFDVDDQDSLRRAYETVAQSLIKFRIIR